MRDDDLFWEAGREGRLMLQRCADCGLPRHPPAPMCARCQSVAVEDFEGSGRAEVADWVRSTHPARREDAGCIVARLNLPEGVWMVTILEGIAPEAVRQGLPVEIFFREEDGKALPHSRPLGQA
jgi:uncharacterized OB-fold protein